MSRRFAVPLMLATLSSFACASAGLARAASPKPPIAYEVEISKPHAQYVNISVSIPRPKGTSSVVALPAWTPGSYMIRDFARNIYDVRAETPSGQALPITRLDKQSWQVEHRGRDFVLHYRIFADEQTVRTSYVNDHLATLNGSSLFVYLPKERTRSCTLTLELPDRWQAFTALPRTDNPSSPSFVASDYDHLIDNPLQLGTPEHRTFTVDGTQFVYVLEGGHTVGANIDRMVEDTEKVVTALGDAMGGFPMPRYLFLMSITRDGGGGLEHDNSTMMMLPRSAFADEDIYEQAAGLTAHEFFHLWNVRRIRDKALRPYDYSQEVPTRLLWFHEGFTVTIEQLARVRAGLLSPETFLEDLGEHWTDYLKLPGRNYDPIDELSYEAWIKQYKRGPNFPNTAVSYYTKGGFIGLALDLELRLRSAEHGHKGDLFGMFRRLMETFGETERGLTHADIVAAASKEAGEDMAWFFERYVHGTDEIELESLLTKIGVHVQSKAPWESDDLSATEQAQNRVFLGIDIDDDGKVSNVIPQSPADKAGLMRGDTIIAVDGRQYTRPILLRVAGQRGPGKPLKMHIFRDGTLVEHTINIGENPYRTISFELRPDEELDPKIVSLRDAWLATASVATDTGG